MQPAATPQACPGPHRITLSAAGHFVYVLPPGVGRVELLSGSFTPQGDGRRLGACIISLSLDGDPVALDRQMLARGFHDIEERGHRLSRWTDGCGVLVIKPRAVPCVLEVGVGHVIRPIDAEGVG